MYGEPDFAVFDSVLGVGRVTKEEIKVTEGNVVTMPKAVPLSYLFIYFYLNSLNSISF